MQDEPAPIPSGCLYLTEAFESFRTRRRGQEPYPENPSDEETRAALEGRVDKEWDEDVETLKVAFTEGKLSAKALRADRHFEVARRDWTRAEHPDVLFLFEIVAATWGPLAKYRNSTIYVDGMQFQNWLDENFPSEIEHEVQARPRVSHAKVRKEYEKRVRGWAEDQGPTLRADLAWATEKFLRQVSRAPFLAIRREVLQNDGRWWPPKTGPKGPRKKHSNQV